MWTKVLASPDTPAALLYTSGTTGKPKGAIITHGNLLSNARALNQTWAITADDTLLHVLPMFHVHGLFVAVNTVLLAGASFIFDASPTFNVERSLDAFARSTLFMAVPTHYTRLLASEKLHRDAVSRMRLFVSGSAPMDVKTWNAFKERTGQPILERYGMTEGQMITSNPLEPELRRPGTVGQALPGISVRLNADSVLEYVGPNVCSGYWNAPSKTAESFTDDGYFISGDVASLDSDGYVAIQSRVSDLIIAGGLNIYPSEVEKAIQETLHHLPSLEVAVVGLPHADLGEVPVAFVTSEDVNEDAIRKQLKTRLAAFKVPKRLVFIEQLPRNAMGKVQKSQLKKQYAELF